MFGIFLAKTAIEFVDRQRNDKQKNGPVIEGESNQGGVIVGTFGLQ